MKCSGWRRIGIVLSVIWFVGFGGFLWIASVNHNAGLYGLRLRMCDAILDADNEALQHITKQGDRALKAFDNSMTREKCGSDAEKVFLDRDEQLYRGIPILLGVDFATVIVGWLIVWVVISIFRWISRGFASA